MKEDNKNIIIGLLILAVGGLGYVYLKKKNKDKAETSGDGILNSAVIPNSTTGSSTTGASTDTSKADKEKADNDKAIEKANKDRIEKETLDKANAIAIKLMNNYATLLSLRHDATDSSNFRINSDIQSTQMYQNQKMDLLYELSNLGYKWSYPNQFATKI